MALMDKMADWNSTRKSLLCKLKNWDDQESWREFFNTYSRLVYSVALKSGLTDSEAQEVVQETFIAVAKKLPEFKYDPEIGSFKSWLLHTTQWRIVDQLRKRKKQAQFQSRCGTETGTSQIERVPDPASLNLDALYETEWRDSLFSFAVEKVKGKVNAKQYQIFDLYVLKKWPVSKVANTLGVSSGSVYLVKHRLSQLVKKELKALEMAP